MKIAWTKPLNILLALMFLSATSLCLYFLFPPLAEDNYAYWETITLQVLLSLLLTIAIIRIKYNNMVLTLLPGATLGGIFFIYVLGLKLVDPTQIDWLMRGDWQWHFMGWHLFRQEPWQWPLGQLDNFWFPIGTSIGYTDSIPLLALLFKPFSAFLPTNFQYIGLWLLSCFVLQGIFAALLLSRFNERSSVQWLGTLFFVLSPILLFRYVHAALCAHWLLLAGLGLYFSPTVSRPLRFWVLLIIISAATHPYLTVMVLGLACAFYGQWVFNWRRCSVTQGLLVLVFLVLLAFAVQWLVGYFLISDKNMEVGGLGYYSLNLLAPFNPLGWSSLLKDLPLVTDGQYEGFNYLGAGILLLLVGALYDLNRRPVSWYQLKLLAPLLVVSLGFVLLALGGKVTVGPYTLIDFQHPHINELLGIFRSTGRFFWPVYYLIIGLTLALVLKRTTPRTAVLYLSLSLMVQWVDLQAHYQTYRQRRWDPDWQAWHSYLKSDIWKFAPAYYRHITLLPPIACGEPAAPYQPFALLAGYYGLTINSGRLARFDVERTQQYCQQLQHAQVDDETIYVVHPDNLIHFKQKTSHPLSCSIIDSFNVCVTEASYARWQTDYIRWKDEQVK